VESADDDTGMTRTILARLNNHERRIAEAERRIAAREG
jgi:hypothetical protein